MLVPDEPQKRSELEPKKQVQKTNESLKAPQPAKGAPQPNQPVKKASGQASKQPMGLAKSNQAKEANGAHQASQGAKQPDAQPVNGVKGEANTKREVTMTQVLVPADGSKLRRDTNGPSVVSRICTVLMWSINPLLWDYWALHHCIERIVMLS
jgi:hypothetical protein